MLEHMLDHTKHRALGKYFHKSVTIKKTKITNERLKLFIIFEIALNKLQYKKCRYYYKMIKKQNINIIKFANLLLTNF